MTTLEIQGGLITALLALGALLKHAVRSEAINRWIPLLLVAVGMPAYCALLADWQPVTWLQAFLTVTSATGIHQTITRPTGLKL